MQRGTGKIEPGHFRAAPYQAQGVPSDMALQMQHALSGNVAKLGRFDRVKRVFAGPKSLKQIGAREVARVNCGALIPVPPVYFDVVGHPSLMWHLQKTRK